MQFLSAKLIANLSGLALAISNIQVKINDVVDILIITILIYVAIRFLRETHSLPLVVGILSLVLVYGISIGLDLPLTRHILASFFGVFLIFIAIIFQIELRRFFSSFGFFNLARRLRPPRDNTIQEIAKAVGELIRKKIGAIIVFPGRNPIGRLLEGGYPLHGEVSGALLLSIFDPSSPGHDGATVITDDRIMKFGVHLPLGEQYQKVKNMGLRHRSALGLSERSDALVVVASEERGQISIAQKGELRSLADEHELEMKLREFYSENFPKRHMASIFNWLAKNIIGTVASLMAALIIWFFFTIQSTSVQRSIAVSPEFKNVASQYVVQDIDPQEILLTVQGRSSEFDSLKPENIKLVVDLGAMKTIGYHNVPLAPSDVKLPLSFSLVQFSPEVVQVHLTKSQ